MKETPKPDLDPTSVAQAVAYADDWLAFRRRYLRIPGVQAAVWYDDALTLSTAHGYADVEREEPLTTSQLFRIASHSPRPSPRPRSCNWSSAACCAWTTPAVPS